jgi:hypothetical protein
LPLPSRPLRGPAPRRRWSGNLRAPLPSSIFSTIQLTQGRMSMGARRLIPHVAQQRIRVGGGFSSLLTSGRFVSTIGIRPLLRGKNLWQIRPTYGRIA